MQKVKNSYMITDLLAKIANKVANKLSLSLNH